MEEANPSGKGLPIADEIVQRHQSIGKIIVAIRSRRILLTSYGFEVSSNLPYEYRGLKQKGEAIVTIG